MYLLHVTYPSGTVQTLPFPSALLRALWIISLVGQGRRDPDGRSRGVGMRRRGRFVDAIWIRARMQAKDVRADLTASGKVRRSGPGRAGKPKNISEKVGTIQCPTRRDKSLSGHAIPAVQIPDS